MVTRVRNLYPNANSALGVALPGVAPEHEATVAMNDLECRSGCVGFTLTSAQASARTREVQDEAFMRITELLLAQTQFAFTYFSPSMLEPIFFSAVATPDLDQWEKEHIGRLEAQEQEAQRAWAAQPSKASVSEEKVECRETVMLFPLDEVVAFPSSAISLRIFEPRYKKLVKQCLEQGRVFGLCDSEFGTTVGVDVLSYEDGYSWEVAMHAQRRFRVVEGTRRVIPSSFGLIEAEVEYFDDERTEAGGEAGEEQEAALLAASLQVASRFRMLYMADAVEAQEMPGMPPGAEQVVGWRVNCVNWRRAERMVHQLQHPLEQLTPAEEKASGDESTERKLGYMSPVWLEAFSFAVAAAMPIKTMGKKELLQNQSTVDRLQSLAALLDMTEMLSDAGELE
ncbi:hypothetical protein CYMTET_52437 [Cymbomonas tetramitiformis]|uniref:Lon N-terminal domain-containing protein n=1 Tax=Cymbomonas tetramitiformis TaxID=36881 RepID=A0AAE0BJ09_9CHLO|nr:hypothetical protein CYMTET_52437 [Cymbomonas tetramitiformis]